MKLSRIHAYEIAPQKNVAAPADPLGGTFKPSPTIVATLGSLMTASRLSTEALVAFRSRLATTGVASNPVRDLFLRFCFGSSPVSAASGVAIARRLSLAMDERSKSLLLFIAAHKDGLSRRLNIWVFPSDEAFQFKATKTSTDVKLLTDVFNKSSKLRKAALFQGANEASDFWEGRVIDLQSSKDDGDAANYWIENFLDCRLALEGKSGTRHLVSYLKSAYESGDYDARDQLHSAMVAVRTTPRSRFSYLNFANRYLSGATKRHFLQHVPDDQKQLAFDFDRSTFESKLSFRVFELAQNVWVSSPLDEVGKSVEVIEDGSDRRLHIDAEIVDERVRARHA